ncbi:MAG: transglutaminase-like domain-containing protein [Syntrophothermus sp.]
MKKSFFLLFILLSFIQAQTKYPQLNSELKAGNFNKAASTIDSVLVNEKGLSFIERSDLEFQKEKLSRIRLDFKRTAADVLAAVKKYYPDADEKMLAQWENTGSLETMTIDGQKKYFNRAASNLFLINKEAKAQKVKTAGPVKDALDEFLNTHLPGVIKDAETRKSRLAKPVKMTISYSLTVNPDAVPDGEIIRCWMPYPREGHARQTDIKFLGCSSKEYTIASNDNMHRTLYMEQKAVKGKPAVFNMSYEYTCLSEWFSIDSAKVLPYNKETDLYKTYTQQRAPHIVFTDEIKKLSEKIVGRETNPYLKAKRIFEWISSNIPWAGAREYSTLENIPAYCLENGHGDCGIKTLLFMTLARYNEIPVKWQSGWMMHPVEVNLHDWCEAYFEGYGWVPVDQSFGVQNYSSAPEVRDFYTNGIDSYRLIVNDDYSAPLYPVKVFPRSETVDFQRGEVEWRGGNLYFDKWDYHMDIKYQEL